jgi:hypothetical protein
MAGRILLDKCSPALDDDGHPDATGVVGEASTLLFRLTGTTTELDAYTDDTLSTAHPNPLTSDDAGRFPQLWGPNDAIYDIVWTRSNGDQDTLYKVGTIPNGGGVAARTDAYVIPMADLVSSLTASTLIPKQSIRMPFAWTLTEVRGFLYTPQTGGTLVTLDVKVDGVSIFTTKPTFDNGERTTVTAGTPNVLLATTIADDAKVDLYVTQIGDGSAIGAGCSLIGFPTL